MSTSRTTHRLAVALALVALCLAPQAAAQDHSRLDEVLDAIVANERYLAGALGTYQPLVETYLQSVTHDATLGSVPVSDKYFIGRLELPGLNEDGTRPKQSRRKTLKLLDDFRSRNFRPESFARMLILDHGTFDREHYEFEFIRAEFLGEIRALVFDVTPRSEKVSRLSSGRFTGRIWVEDRDYNVVRYNGIYKSALSDSFHFDSWRLNLASGEWLPAYVYTEEAELIGKREKITHKGQTRIWGYRIARPDAEDEFTKVLIDAPKTNDPSDRPGQISPLESARAWESEAEDNVLQRLERAGLVAPEGEVDKVLQTVVANLEITNGLDIRPPVRCRVLLTTPLESLTIGHTIVLSRGLIDVLPDEASLAMVLAHELGHVLSGHEVDTKYAFSDQMLVGDKQALEDFAFDRDPLEELEADNRAVILLQNSPYKNDLAGAGLFLKMLEASAGELPALIRPHLGHRMEQQRLVRMAQIVEAAPELDLTSLTQIAALPLGGRVMLDPWSARIELMKNNQAALLSVREKMPLQVTPLMPYLARHDAPEPIRKSSAPATAEPATRVAESK